MKKTMINTNQINTSILTTNNEVYNTLNFELHSVLIGIMLGDGSLYKSSNTANVRLEMSFGKKYKLFALHIGDLFKEYINNPVKALEIKGKNNNYINYRLKTKTLPVFVEYFNMFYKFNKDKNKFIKIVPTKIEDYIDPISLAYLIMTDGNFDKGRNRVRIYTNSFKKEEVEILSKAIYSKLNIYTGVLHDRKDQWILTIGANKLNLLREIVNKHFHSSMLYRIGL